MTIEEIFSKLFTHMKGGISIHCAMSQCFDFLGLRGFSACHAYHYIEEAHAYMCLTHFYTLHYYKLSQEEETPKPTIIPDTWYKYTTAAVDTNTKRSSTKELMNKWVEWERDTKKLYEQMYSELIKINEICAALRIQECITDVSKELLWAEKKQLKLETLSYDMENILIIDDKLNKKYER